MSNRASEDTMTQNRLVKRQKKRKKRLRKVRNSVFGVLIALLALVGAGYGVGFLTPWGNRARIVLAETIVSTRHYYLARYITTHAEYHTLRTQLSKPVKDSSIPVTGSVSVGPPSPNSGPSAPAQTGSAKLPKGESGATNPPVSKVKNVQIKKISGKGYNGFVMLVHNPRTIRLVHAQIQNGKGEYITHMAKRVGAVAGTNASGFLDPKGNGWGAKAYGLEYVGGQVLHGLNHKYGMVTLGFTKSGKMVMGTYAPQQLQHLRVQDAMQFYPELVVDGKPMITHGDGGWGYGPRTAVGQTKNGTVIFVVINGRFHGGSGMGASQRQVMNIMLEYGAVNACAMDGGSSSVLYSKGQILNSPSTIDPNGQRHLPDAWIVFPTAAAAQNYHVTSGSN